MLNLEKAKIINILKLLAHEGRTSFVIRNRVAGEMTLTIEKALTWNQVLDIVLEMSGLRKVTEEKNTLQIVPADFRGQADPTGPNKPFDIQINGLVYEEPALASMPLILFYIRQVSDEDKMYDTGIFRIKQFGGKHQFVELGSGRYAVNSEIKGRRIHRNLVMSPQSVVKSKQIAEIVKKNLNRIYRNEFDSLFWTTANPVLRKRTAKQRGLKIWPIPDIIETPEPPLRQSEIAAPNLKSWEIIPLKKNNKK